MVIVRTQFPEAATTSPTIYADLEVQFAGQTAHYKHVPFQRVTQGNEVRISGTIPATCSDFKIDRAFVPDRADQERNPGAHRNDLAPNVSTLGVSYPP